MKRIGLIDIGSNTIRLVIFEFDKKTGLDEVLNIKTPARLSQYLTNDLTMTQEGIEVLTTTLSSFKRVSDKVATDELHPIATAAIKTIIIIINKTLFIGFLFLGFFVAETLLVGGIVPISSILLGLANPLEFKLSCPTDGLPTPTVLPVKLFA